MAEPDLLGRRLLVVTGKGGVGKSTVAAALALVAARRGKRVLVVDVDAKGTIAERFEAGTVGFKPREVMPGVSVMAMDTEASLAEYIRLNLRIPILGRLGPIAGMLDFVATAAPGVKEILTIGKVCWEVRESIEGRADWDLVVVDAAATGHVIAQLGAADAIRDLVAVGPVRGQTAWMSELLSDPAITALNVVTTPEEMPVQETIDLVARAREELDVPLGVVVVNRVLPELFTTHDEAVFEQLAVPPVRDELAAPGRTRYRRRHRGGPVGGDDAAQPGRAPAGAARHGGPADALRAVPVRPIAGSTRDRAGGRCPDGGAGPVSAAPVANSASLESVLASKEIVVFCGSGGVGKTSIAAAAGLAAATRLGGKVLVVTVDPAKRLADALGVEGIGNVEVRVPENAFTEAGLGPRGELWAAMLDTKQSWDALVLRHAPDEETAYRILDNRLYDNLTARFVQSHDYVAMERLFEIHQTGKYDLIVVDTPPTRNALDFLDAPARMAEFFGGRLLRWLTAPYRVGGKRGARVLDDGEQALLPGGRSPPRQSVPAGHRRVLPELPVDVRRFRRPLTRGRGAAARPAHDVRGRHHAGGRAVP